MGFERCHPAANLTFFTEGIAGMILFQHPVFLLLGFLCACIYSVQRNRGKAAIILGMTDMTYDPRLIWEPINPLTILLYAGYTILCLMPFVLELWTEYQFRKARGTI